MKIALLGYGKMGHEIEKAAIEAGHTIVATFDEDKLATADALRKSGAKVAIDFSQPTAVEKNVQLCVEAGIPIVIGTTGWDSKLENVRTLIEDSHGGCIVGSNFSIGVNIFLQVVRVAARLANTAGYDAYISEAHHRAKKDFPSGTAQRLSEILLSELQSKSQVITELPHGMPLPPDALHVSSIRAGGITGRHTVGFESEEDSIELTHNAKNRRGFAIGAVRAAEWIENKKGFFRFEEYFGDIIELK